MAVDHKVILAKAFGGEGFDRTQDDVNNLINTHSKTLTAADSLVLSKTVGKALWEEASDREEE